MNRREAMGRIVVGAAGAALGLGPAAAAMRAAAEGNEPVNVILCMTDDQGWGDAGYHGHPVLKTPNLDALAAAGLRMDRFYAAAPVCSPTRGSCLTGRHPYRYGIFFANVGHLPKEEFTLAEALQGRGYATGHFGKWHLGTLTRTERDSNRGGPAGAAHYAPPWERGFQECFSTEAKVPTWDPMLKPGTAEPYGTAYWTGPGVKAADNLQGDDSRVLMDRAIPFIRRAVAAPRPFLAVIWFHTPHEPVRGGQPFLDMYKDVSDDGVRHYYAAVTAMDAQVGRLRKELRDLGAAGDTMLWFSSDNGPEHKSGPGSAGPFRGRKRDLYEGGVRVPGILEWPARVRTPRTTQVPCSSSDILPTVLDVVGHPMTGAPEPRDGLSLVPLLDGRMTQRPRPIAFESGKQLALTDNRWKLISADGGRTYELYDLVADPAEARNVAADYPDVVASMRGTLLGWRASCDASRQGKDYRPPG